MKLAILGVTGAVLALLALALFRMDELKDVKSSQSEMEQTIALQSNLINQLERLPPSPHSQVSREKATLMGYIVSPVANTGSMEPLINGESLLLLDKAPVSIGDVVVYESGIELWAHRIIGEYEDYWVCQGDANRSENQREYVPKGRVVWRVMGILY